MHGRRYCVIEETKEMFHVSINVKSSKFQTSAKITAEIEV